jgi:hypothetical protein
MEVRISYAGVVLLLLVWGVAILLHARSLAQAIAQEPYRPVSGWLPLGRRWVRSGLLGALVALGLSVLAAAWGCFSTFFL